MIDRLTPEQIADGAYEVNALAFLGELRSHGWHIVHPDDHPYDCGSIDPEYRSGWKALHHRIFGDNR